MTKTSERRDGPRIDLRLRVRYSVDTLEGEAEASDVSPKGLRLESEAPVEVGSDLKLIVDAGDDETLEATGRVTWCRPRESPTGKTLFDLGVAFDSEWLAQKRGPLGTALARIFAMNSYEPARGYERTPVALKASTASAPPIELEIADMSLGGMQLRAKTGLGDKVRTGNAVIVELELDGKTHSIDGRVAWVAGGVEEGEGAPGPRVGDSFGVQFLDMSDGDESLLNDVRLGRLEPERITVFLQA